MGRIDGIKKKNAVLQGVRLYDSKGLSLSSPRVERDWWQYAWLSNRLDIDRFSMATATLHRWPQFKPSVKEWPILPDFDIRLASLSVGRLTIAKAVTGKRQAATLQIGRAHV